jgi:Domain of unknown function (DUF6438)
VTIDRPNIALQRTPSAAPPSPLSFGTLGRLAGAGLSVSLLFVAGCATAPKHENLRMSGPRGVLESEYASAHPEPEEWNDPTALTCRDLDAKTGVTEIALERTGCFGFCAMYTVTLRADGAAVFEGRGNVKLVGRYTGRVAPGTFEALARLAQEIGLLDRLSSRQFCAVTDHPTAYVLVAKGGERRVIKHYAPDLDGPATLWWFEQAVDLVQGEIKWQKAQ